jgi:DNA polymerase III delta subunit
MANLTKSYWSKTDSGEESEVDLEEELFALADHVHDRKRLLKEAVRSLKGKRLKAMIPPLLKVRWEIVLT